MNPEYPANPAGQAVESATILRQRRVIFQQRFCIVLLLAATTGSLIAARGERSRADLLQSNAMSLQIREEYAESLAATAVAPPDAGAEGPMQTAPLPLDGLRGEPVSTGRDPFARASQYPVTVIAGDGSTQPLHAKALNIGLGNGRGLEIDLTRDKSGHLFMWAPAHVDDDIWHRIVLHPCCANALQLELSPVTVQDAANSNEEFRFTDGSTGNARRYFAMTRDQVPASSVSKSR